MSSIIGEKTKITSDLLYSGSYFYANKNDFIKAKLYYKNALKESNGDYLNADIINIFSPYIQIETIRAFNAKCVMCPLEKSETKNEVMKDEVFNRILEEIKYWPQPPSIALHGLGEPLMDKRIVERIKILKMAGLPNVSLVSNGSLMTENIAQNVINSGITDMHFSIESVNKTTFESIRKGLFIDDVLNGITTFIDTRNKLESKVSVKIMYTYSDNNKLEYKNEFRDFFKKILNPELGDQISLMPIHSFGVFDKYNNENNDLCYQIFNNIHIRADGRVSLCCIDVDSKFDIGNINNSSIMSIFNNKKMREFRHGL